MTKNDFVSYVNTMRKQNKNHWYQGIVSVIFDNSEQKTIKFKGYNTWLQILDVDGVRYPCAMDISVKQFIDVLNRVH